MSIISQLFAIAGEMDGMPVIEESGLCTSDGATLNAIRRYECEALQISRVPRRSGLTAKSLISSGQSTDPGIGNPSGQSTDPGIGNPSDGMAATVKTITLADPSIGRFQHCVQIGRTKTQQYAPAQPIGPFAGLRIIRYSRTWVQLQE